jgi:hypothetical protein
MKALVVTLFLALSVMSSPSAFADGGYVMGCTDSHCSSIYVPTGFQLGCPKDASSCSAIYVPAEYQLGCTNTNCNVFYVPAEYQLGCTDTSCSVIYVP